MTAQTLSVLDLIDGLIADARDGLVSLPVFNKKTKLPEIWHELSFCIVSSQERTRRALSASAALFGGYDKLTAERDTLGTVRAILADHYVSLRFINRKSEHLAASWNLMMDHAQLLTRIDESFSCPSDARQFLIETFPGLGPKQASMLLRNIGYGADLAIIDTHVARLSSMILRCDAKSDSYFSVESRLRVFADERKINLQTLDVILWSCSRMMQPNRLGERLLV